MIQIHDSKSENEPKTPAQEISQQNSSVNWANKILPVRMQTIVSAGILSMMLLFSPIFTPKASASWVRFARVLFRGAVILLLEEGMRSNSATAAPSNAPQGTNAQAIKNKLSGGTVDYSNDTSEMSGKVERVWQQNRQRANETGIGGKIRWNDGVVSTILFLDGSRVRVWSSGKEYGGQWGWSGGTLYVRMDAGGFYRFR
jgi:hypothetical protein